MAYSSYLDETTSDFINMWSDGAANVDVDWFTNGKKVDGVSSFTLLKTPPNFPTLGNVRSATLRLTEYSSSYRLPNALTMKVSRLKAPFTDATRWSTCPDYEHSIVGTKVFDSSNAPGPTNYDFSIPEYHPGYWEWIASYGAEQKPDEMPGYKVVWDSVEGCWDRYKWHSAYYTYVYCKYQTIDIKAVIQDCILNGQHGLILWHDTSTTPSSSRKYFKSPSNTDDRFKPLLTIDTTLSTVKLTLDSGYKESVESKILIGAPGSEAWKAVESIKVLVGAPGSEAWKELA